MKKENCKYFFIFLIQLLRNSLKLNFYLPHKQMNMNHNFGIKIVLVAPMIIVFMSQVEMALANTNQPHFNIFLSKSVGERWKEVAEHFGPKLNESIYDCLFAMSVKHGLEVNHLLQKFEELGHALKDQTITKSYILEAEALATNANISKSLIMFQQLMYDYAINSTGAVVLGNNAQFWGIKTFNLDCYKSVRDLGITISLKHTIHDRKEIFHGATIAGMVGVTGIGVATDFFTLVMNKLMQNSTLLEMLETATTLSKNDTNVWPLAYFTRHLLEKRLKIPQASEIIRYAVLTAPATFMFGKNFHISTQPVFGYYCERRANKRMPDDKIHEPLRKPDLAHLSGNFLENSYNWNYKDSSLWNMEWYLTNMYVLNDEKLRVSAEIWKEAARFGSEETTAFWVLMCGGSSCPFHQRGFIGKDQYDNMNTKEYYGLYHDPEDGGFSTQPLMSLLLISNLFCVLLKMTSFVIP